MSGAHKPEDLSSGLSSLSIRGGGKAGGGSSSSMRPAGGGGEAQRGGGRSGGGAALRSSHSKVPHSTPTLDAAAEQEIYAQVKIVGSGSFGVVFSATHRETGEIVAIKKVLQDRRFKNRELQIMRTLDHPNVVKLQDCYYTKGDKADDVYLNLVLEFIPDTVYHIERQYTKTKHILPVVQTKLYMYQLLRSLAYIHAKGICHRDIKPQNLLVDPEKFVLKLCDFGSAKTLVRGEPNIAYICSRYYRAPELIFGATDYAPAIDMWSTGCVMAELLLGQPLFPGESSVDQLVEIIKVLGTPTKEELYAMNKNYTEFKFPQVKQYPWAKVFRSKTPPEAIALLAKLLIYTPERRISPLEACAHPFFDEMRAEGFRLPTGRPLPDVFLIFTQTEIDEAARIDSGLMDRLVPSWFSSK